MKKTTIGIPTYNRPELLAITLSSLVNLKGDFDVHIIDSSDEPIYIKPYINVVIRLLEEKGHEVEISSISKKLPVSKALAYFIINLDTEFLFVLNDDCFVEPNTLEELMLCMTYFKKIGLIEAMQPVPGKSKVLDYIPSPFNQQNDWGHWYRYNKNIVVDSDMIGGFYLLRKSVIKKEQVDQILGIGSNPGEERVLSDIVKSNEFTISSHTGAIVWHMSNEYIPSNFNHKEHYGERIER